MSIEQPDGAFAGFGVSGADFFQNMSGDPGDIFHNLDRLFENI